MAEKGKITARLSPTVHTLLQQAAQERACSQSEVIETALLAFLAPKEGQAMEDVIMHKLVALEAGMEAMVRVLTTLVPPQPSPDTEERPPIATYEQMYGPDFAAPAPEAAAPDLAAASPGPPPPSRSRLRRWLLKEDPA